MKETMKIFHCFFFCVNEIIAIVDQKDGKVDIFLQKYDTIIAFSQKTMKISIEIFTI